MKETHGTQTVEVVAGRKIILSAGKGQTNVDDLKWLMSTVLRHAAGWKATGWAYLPTVPRWDRWDQTKVVSWLK